MGSTHKTIYMPDIEALRFGSGPHSGPDHRRSVASTSDHSSIVESLTLISNSSSNVARPSSPPLSLAPFDPRSHSRMTEAHDAQ